MWGRIHRWKGYRECLLASGIREVKREGDRMQPIILTWSRSALIRASPLTALPKLMREERMTVSSALKRTSS